MLFAAGTGAILADFAAGPRACAQGIVPLSNPFGRGDTGHMRGWTAGGPGTPAPVFSKAPQNC
ncbi:MAG: hypothetical protein NXH83_15245 [Rhodobacteraceae bacterium]|nr:hypothetical protein [Paracoccaceae bacterium]